jgi:hypothetical protein
MKANIISSLGFKLTDNFKTNLRKLLPDNVSEVWLFDFGMKWKGFGLYSYYLSVEINEEKLYFTYENTDSESYDFWKGAERNREIDNFEKRRILSLFEQYQDELNNMEYKQQVITTN